MTETRMAIYRADGSLVKDLGAIDLPAGTYYLVRVGEGVRLQLVVLTVPDTP